MKIHTPTYGRIFLAFFAFLTVFSIFSAESISSELRFNDKKNVGELESAIRLQEQRMKAQERLLREYQVMLEQQRTELDALKHRMDAGTAAQLAPGPAPYDPYRLQPVAMPGLHGGGAPDGQSQARPRVSPAAGQPKSAQPTAATEKTEIEESKPKPRPDVPLIVEKGGVLLHRGQVVVEPSIDFSLVETNRVEVAGFTVLPAILVGNFTVSQVQRETETAALSARIGVTDRIELEARVPYINRDDRETRRPIGSGSDSDETVSLSGYGLGDIEMAGHYQINDGTGRWPYFVGNLRAKSDTGTSPFDVSTDSSGNPTELPTGSGFWSLQPSVTAIMPTDPAVVFANLNYTWNIARDVSGYGEIDPGNSFGGSLGVGFALNEKLSMSMAYDHTYVMETTQNGQDNNSAFHIGRMLFGGSFKFADNASANLNFAVGVTEQAPDIQTELRVPITFQAFGD